LGLACAVGLGFWVSPRASGLVGARPGWWARVRAGGRARGGSGLVGPGYWFFAAFIAALQPAGISHQQPT